MNRGTEGQGAGQHAGGAGRPQAGPALPVHSPLSEHRTNRNSAATRFTSVSKCVMRRTSLFRNSSPTSGRVLTSRSGGSTWGAAVPQPGPEAARVCAWDWPHPLCPYLGLQELPGRAVHAGALGQHAQHGGHALLQPVRLQKSLCHQGCAPTGLEMGATCAPGGPGRRCVGRGPTAVPQLRGQVQAMGSLRELQEGQGRNLMQEATTCDFRKTISLH